MTPAAVPGTPPVPSVLRVAPPPLAPVEARVKAYLVDAVVNGVLALPLLGLHLWVVVRGLMPGATADHLAALGTATVVTPVLGVLLSAVLYVVVPTRMRGMTIGKRVTCLRVTRDDGSEAGWREHLVRFLALYVDGIVAVAPGLVLVATRADRKRLGDMAARTVVVVSE